MGKVFKCEGSITFHCKPQKNQQSGQAGARPPLMPLFFGDALKKEYGCNGTAMLLRSSNFPDILKIYPPLILTRSQAMESFLNVKAASLLTLAQQIQPNVGAMFAFEKSGTLAKRFWKTHTCVPCPTATNSLMCVHSLIGR